MITMLTGGKMGGISAGLGLGVLAILYGFRMLQTGGDPRFYFIAGAFAIVAGLIAAAIFKPWGAASPEFGKVDRRAPYDRPASLNPRNDSYMRMIDPDRERPRHY